MLQMDLNIRNSGPAMEAPRLPTSGFTIAAQGSCERRRIEARVQEGFCMHFGAAIHQFMPELAVYRHAGGSSGIVGIRRASAEPLFLEKYLDRPIDAEIAALVALPVDRESIAEIGQFVVDDRDIVGDLFRDLVPFLRENGFEWVTFTATGVIRALLARIGFHGKPIACADAARLGSDTSHWGNYYDKDPMVIVGRLDDPRGRWCHPGATGNLRAAS
jgi:hypothetical protein